MEEIRASKTIEVFQEIYKKEAERVAFTPYRVCPLGAHSDHQLGKITGLAIDKGIHIAYDPKQNGVVELRSLQFDKRCQFHIQLVPKEKENDWAALLLGFAKRAECLQWRCRAEDLILALWKITKK